MAKEYSNSAHSHSNHSHSHAHNKNKKALLISFILIASFMFVEFVGGIMTNSLALLSDAGHMLSDAVALGLSLSAIVFGERVATQSKTFGYKRFEILAAFINGLILISLSIYIFIEAIHRLSQPSEVMGEGMMIIAIIGLIVNIVVAFILSRGQTKDNLNVRSAFMHVLGDLLGSVGAIIAGALILLFDWTMADPIASMIVSVLVLYSGWNILRDSLNILMEGKPGNVNSELVIEAIRQLPEVEDIHDLHIWMIASDFPSLTAHINVNKEVDRDIVLEKIIRTIIDITGINHITIQLEGRKLDVERKICCKV